MSKELPYYQFEVAEYLAGDIMICSLEAQGLFSIIKCIYWQKECELNVKQILKRYDNQKLLNELIEENCIKVDSNGKIIIDFLLDQYTNFRERKRKLSEAGRKGGLVKQKASLKPRLNDTKATPKHIEEKREEENKGEDSIIHIEKAYEFLKSKNPIEIEAFEINNKKSFAGDFEKFVTHYNYKVILDDIEWDITKLMAKLMIVNNNWDKTKKEKNSSLKSLNPMDTLKQRYEKNA